MDPIESVAFYSTAKNRVTRKKTIEDDAHHPIIGENLAEGQSEASALPIENFS